MSFALIMTWPNLVLFDQKNRIYLTEMGPLATCSQNKLEIKGQEGLTSSGCCTKYQCSLTQRFLELFCFSNTMLFAGRHSLVAWSFLHHPWDKWSYFHATVTRLVTKFGQPACYIISFSFNTLLDIQRGLPSKVMRPGHVRLSWQLQTIAMVWMSLWRWCWSLIFQCIGWWYLELMGKVWVMGRGSSVLLHSWINGLTD